MAQRIPGFCSQDLGVGRSDPLREGDREPRDFPRPRSLRIKSLTPQCPFKRLAIKSLGSPEADPEMRLEMQLVLGGW